jgi:hypothetical protein
MIKLHKYDIEKSPHNSVMRAFIYEKLYTVGLSISGISSAIALKQAEWDSVIIEKNSECRKGGYFIKLFELDRYTVKDLGVLQFLHDRCSVTSINISITNIIIRKLRKQICNTI